MNHQDVDYINERISLVSNGLEVLGELMLDQRNSLNKVSLEKLGNLILLLSDYLEHIYQQS